MEIREIENADLHGLLQLYTQLHDNVMPTAEEQLQSLWEQILQDKQHHIIVGVKNGKIVTSCVVVIILNLTHEQRPYALIENVITDSSCRNKGYASSVLNYAKELAQKEHCYKMMLLTGSNEEATLNFYRNSGYNSSDKTGFIQWL